MLTSGTDYVGHPTQGCGPGALGLLGAMAKILIADDHESGRAILRTILTQQGGWTVCGEAVNGLQAVRLAHELKPDLIVLDFSMPIFDGLQAAREILTITPAVPIILFTLHFSPQLQAGALRAGLRKVVPKDGGAPVLIAAIEEFLGCATPPVGPLRVVPDQKAAPVVAPIAAVADESNDSVPLPVKNSTDALASASPVAETASARSPESKS